MSLATAPAQFCRAHVHTRTMALAAAAFAGMDTADQFVVLRDVGFDERLVGMLLDYLRDTDFDRYAALRGVLDHYHHYGEVRS